MGYNTVLMLLNDRLSDITKNPQLGDNLLEAVQQSHVGKKADVCSGLKVLDQFHSSELHLIVAGGNTGWAVWRDKLPVLTDKSDRQALKSGVEKLASALGFTLTPKPPRKNRKKKSGQASLL